VSLLGKLGLTKWEVRDLAHEFRLRHSAACREANGRHFPYRCTCDFFEKIKQAKDGLLIVCHRVICGKHETRIAAGILPLGWAEGNEILSWKLSDPALSSGRPFRFTYCSEFCRAEIEPERAT